MRTRKSLNCWWFTWNTFIVVSNEIINTKIKQRARLFERVGWRDVARSSLRKRSKKLLTKCCTLTMRFRAINSSFAFTAVAWRCCVFLSRQLGLITILFAAVGSSIFSFYLWVEDVAHMENYRELFMTLNDWMSLWGERENVFALTSARGSYQRSFA